MSANMNPNGIARGNATSTTASDIRKPVKMIGRLLTIRTGFEEQAQERVGVPRLDPRLLLEVRFELIEGGDRHHVDDGNAVNLMLGPVRKRIGARALHRAAGCRKHDAIDLEAEEPPRRSRFVERQAEGLPVLLDLGSVNVRSMRSSPESIVRRRSSVSYVVPSGTVGQGPRAPRPHLTGTPR